MYKGNRICVVVPAYNEASQIGIVIDTMPIRAHCCLGIFSNKEKAQRVIPYKAFQALSSAKPLITARTEATEKLFTDNVDALLVEPEDPRHLAEAIQKLSQDRKDARELGINGRKLYEEQFSN